MFVAETSLKNFQETVPPDALANRAGRLTTGTVVHLHRSFTDLSRTCGFSSGFTPPAVLSSARLPERTVLTLPSPPGVRGRCPARAHFQVPFGHHCEPLHHARVLGGLSVEGTLVYACTHVKSADYRHIST